MILVLLSSMVPYILPHAWLGEHYPGYDFYMFKGMAWTLKLALLIYLYGIIRKIPKNFTCRAANIIRVRRRFSVIFCSVCCFFCSCI